MKFILLLFTVTIAVYSCSEPFMIEEKIYPVRISISIKSPGESPGLYHIYYKHIKEKSFSRGIVTESSTSKIELFPGTYTIYLYKLADKSEKYKKVISYRVIRDVKIFSPLCLSEELILLSPVVKHSREQEGLRLWLPMDGVYELFTISSLSVKQGSSRNKSVSPGYNKHRKRYEVVVPVNNEGLWFINISYALRSSKIDKVSLKEAGISVSTSNFSNVPLGLIK